MAELRVCTCDKRPDRGTGKPGIDPATGQRWTFDTLPRCDCPTETEDDHARLRAAVGEWARAGSAYGVDWLPEYNRAVEALLALARELGLVEGGAA